jgi:hypothetical protein
MPRATTRTPTPVDTYSYPIPTRRAPGVDTLTERQRQRRPSRAPRSRNLDHESTPPELTTPEPSAANSSVPSWQLILGAPVADAVRVLRAAGVTMRVTAGRLDASGPAATWPAIRALAFRGWPVVQHLLAETSTPHSETPCHTASA